MELVSLAALVIMSCISAVAATAQTSAQREMNERNIEFQKETNAEQMAFNSAEAEKNRQWQEQMSNTQVQRAMADYQAAGLNPILAATGGASYGSVSSAQASLAAPQQGQAVSGIANVMNGISSVIQTYTNLMLTKNLIDSKSNFYNSKADMNNGVLSDLIGTKAMKDRVETKALLNKLEYYANKPKTSAKGYYSWYKDRYRG